MLPDVFLTVFLLVLFHTTRSSDEFIKLRHEHRPQELNQSQLQRLADLSNVTHINEVLDNILIPRVVGTPNHEKVFKYIVGQLRGLDWDVKVDEFKDRTPNFGQLTFKNIIATLNPQAERFLVLACHYDSKYFENEVFVGAIDSAVPCAMMLNLAFVMRRELENIKNRHDVSLKLVFFDGEEAFVAWGPNDSIYGAKHLANRLYQTKSISRFTGETVTDLDRMDVLVLLDLIGARDPHFYSFFRNTEKWYTKLADAERDLGTLGLLKEHPRTYFKRRTSHSYVEDDHIPFLVKNVPILHLIPTPFPKTWHTSRDDRTGVDLNTVENINKILRIFVAQYLHLIDGAIPPTPPNGGYGTYPLQLQFQPIYYNWIICYL